MAGSNNVGWDSEKCTLQNIKGKLLKQQYITKVRNEHQIWRNLPVLDDPKC
jgi:hypothetical protein